MRMIAFLCVLSFACPALGQAIDTPPKLLSEANVVYPPRALEERREASVLLQVDIDENGAVLRSEVLTPSDLPDYGFEAAAQAVVSKFVFEPARAQGTPMAVRVQYLYRFVLPPLAPVTELPGVAASPAPVAPVPAAATVRGELAGTILQRGSRSRLAGVSVTIERRDEAFEALSDAQGRFVFYDLSPGAWSLTVRSEGYLPSRSQEQVAASEQTEVTLYLERSADNPYDVLVESAAPRREVTRHRLDVREAQNQPGSFGDPLMAVQNLPGVAVLNNDGASGIAMRGAASEESSIYLEGFRMPLFYHFIGIRSLVAPGMLESIDVYPGGAPVQYGRQIGGVLEARLKRLSPDRTHGYVDISLLDAGAFVETPIGKQVAIAAAARVSYIDQVMKALGNPLPRYDDYQLLVTARPSAAHNLRLIYLGSDDSFRMNTDDLREESAQITFGTLAVAAHMQHVAFEHEYAPSSLLSNRARLGYLHWNTFTHFGDQGRVDIGYDTLLLRDTFRLTPRDWIAAELGLEAELGRWTTDVLIAPPPKEGEPEGFVDFDKERRSYTSDIGHYAGGAWAQLELRPHRDWLIVPGVRSDVQPQISTLTVDPRLTLRYQAFQQLALKAGTGVHHASPEIDESAKRFGNPNIGAERSLQHSAGVEIKPLDVLQLDLTGFYHRLDGLSVRSDRIRIDGDEIVPLEYENTGRGRVVGFEALLQKQLSHRVSGSLSYTLSRAERKRVAGDEYRLFDADQTHNLVLLAAYHLPRHWRLSTRFRYRTGQPTTNVVGSVFVSDSDEYAPTYGRTNAARNPSFQQLDLRIDKAWVFNSWSFTAYLDIQNVYNRNNAVAVAYNYDYSKSGKVSSVPLLPIFGFKAEY